MWIALRFWNTHTSFEQTTFKRTFQFLKMQAYFTHMKGAYKLLVRDFISFKLRCWYPKEIYWKQEIADNRRCYIHCIAFGTHNDLRTRSDPDLLISQPRWLTPPPTGCILWRWWYPDSGLICSSMASFTHRVSSMWYSCRSCTMTIHPRWHWAHLYTLLSCMGQVNILS